MNKFAKIRLHIMNTLELELKWYQWPSFCHHWNAHMDGNRQTFPACSIKGLVSHCVHRYFARGSTTARSAFDKWGGGDSPGTNSAISAVLECIKSQGFSAQSLISLVRGRQPGKDFSFHHFIFVHSPAEKLSNKRNTWVAIKSYKQCSVFEQILKHVYRKCTHAAETMAFYFVLASTGCSHNCAWCFGWPEGLFSLSFT